MHITAFHFYKKAIQSGIFILVGLLASQVNALERLNEGGVPKEIFKLNKKSSSALSPAAGHQSVSVRGNSKSDSVLLLPVEKNGANSNTRLFGELSLLLSTSLSVKVSELAPSVNSINGNNGKKQEQTSNEVKLNELNAKIAAIEGMIKERQRQLNVVIPEKASSKNQSLSTLKTFGDGALDALEVNSATSLSNVGIAVSRVDGEGLSKRVVDNQPKITESSFHPVAVGDNSTTKLDLMDWLLTLVAFLLAVSGLTWHYRRRRKALHFSRSGIDRGAVDTLGNEPATKFLEADIQKASGLEQVSEILPDIEVMQKRQQPQPIAMQSILPPEYEMLEEADIYLRFGHDKLAEEALREAIKLNPHNPQTYLTLLRILFAREDSSTFLDVAKQLKSLGEQGVWQRVAEMGRNLDSSNPLYH